MIELTPDWIFDTQCTMWFRNYDGTGYLLIDNVYNSYWIVLAFQTLGVKFDVMSETDGNEKNRTWIYDFQIADIKDECPIFYERFMEHAIMMDEVKKRNGASFNRNN